MAGVLWSRVTFVRADTYSKYACADASTNRRTPNVSSCVGLAAITNLTRAIKLHSDVSDRNPDVIIQVSCNKQTLTNCCSHITEFVLKEKVPP